MREQSEREILARIDATRTRLGDTIEEIGDRVNPDRLQRELKTRAREQVEDFKDTVKQKARDRMRDVQNEAKSKGRGLWNMIRENPIPAGMVGVGLAWMLTNGSSDDDDRADYRLRDSSRGRYPGGAMHPDSARVGYRAGYVTARTDPGEDHDEGMASRLREGAEDATERVRDEAHHAADTVREKGSELMDRASEGFDEARDRVGHWADEAQHKARRVEHRVEDAVREHPLAAGMVAAAMGFAAGLMIPETDKEHEWMGATRDRVLDRAQETAHRAGEKAKDVARETAGRSAERAVDEVLGGGEDRDRPGMTGPGR